MTCLIALSGELVGGELGGVVGGAVGDALEDAPGDGRRPDRPVPLACGVPGESESWFECDTPAHAHRAAVTKSPRERR
jgi:hypothetical protein